MQDETHPLRDKVVLVTGGAQRIGAAIVRALHREGMTVALHYLRSGEAARGLQAELEATRAGSVRLFQADLTDTAGIVPLVAAVVAACGRLDALVNNASTFYATPFGAAAEAHWEDLLGTNLKAPFFLAQAAAPHLKAQRGCIVNIADIHGQRPLKRYPVYSIAKAGLLMLTRSLARELAPEVRVNGVSPGPVLWPGEDLDERLKARIVSRTALKREGEPADVATTVTFLIRDAAYVTGQTIAVDGGRSLK